MSYKFVDTNEHQKMDSSLPSEAMKYNGEFIENLIEGYRTLSVSGREVISTVINSFKIGQMPGQRISTTTLPERVITVKYKLVASSAEELMRKFRQLNAILAVDEVGYPQRNVKISFNDEEVFYFGMKADMEIPPEGQLSVISNFTLFCSDPYKYGDSDTYDPEVPLIYDEDHKYGIKSYPNTQKFNWRYTPRHYSGIENHSSFETDLKIIIQGSIKKAKITNLSTGVQISLPDITNGEIIVDSETFLLLVNNVEQFPQEGDFLKLSPGENGFLFEAESANASVNYNWLHKFL